MAIARSRASDTRTGPVTVTTVFRRLGNATSAIVQFFPHEVIEVAPGAHVPVASAHVDGI